MDLESLCINAANIIKLRSSMKKALLPNAALGLKCLPSISRILGLSKAIANCRDGIIRLVDSTSTLDIICVEGEELHTAQSPLIPINTQCPWNPPNLRNQFEEIARKYFEYSSEEVYLNPLPWDRLELLIDDDQFSIISCKASASCKVMKPKWNKKSMDRIIIGDRRSRIEIQVNSIEIISTHEHFSIKIPSTMKREILEYQNYMIIVYEDFLVFINRLQPTELRIFTEKETMVDIKSSVIEPQIFFQQPLSVMNFRYGEDLIIHSPWIAIKGPSTTLTLSARSSKCEIKDKGTVLNVNVKGWIKVGIDLNYIAQAPWRFSWEQLNTIIKSHYTSKQSIIKLSPKTIVPIALGVEEDYVHLALTTFSENPHMLKVTSDYLIIDAQLLSECLQNVTKLLNNSILTTALPCYLVFLKLKLVRPLQKPKLLSSV